MKILDTSTLYDPTITSRNNAFIEIDLLNSNGKRIVKQFSRLGKDQQLLHILRTFNKHIVGVDTKKFEYTVDYNYDTKRSEEIDISLGDLSTGEKLFSLCFMANELKYPMIVCREVGQLDMQHYKLFFKLWGNSDYIDVIIPNDLYSVLINTLYKKCKSSD